MAIYYLDRKTGQKKVELVAGGKYLHLLYGTKAGLPLVWLIKRKIFSGLYGRLQDLPFSRKKIRGFIHSLGIDMREARMEDPSGYRSFNDFFSRELKPEARPIDPDPYRLVAPADGKISAWDQIDPDRMIQVKGSTYSLTDLLQNRELALQYAGGTCVVIRLSPSDYHRFHFPAAGVPSKTEKITGSYYSVNPMALHKIPRLYCTNKRELTVLSSDNFGDILMIEVGATFVGSIVQTYEPSRYVLKGAEKGYFKFGGSTIILLIKKDSLNIDQDLLFNTAEGLETKVDMGERIGGK